MQGVRTNDKHIEVIVRQMLRKVRIKDDPGDTPFLAHEEVDKLPLRRGEPGDPHARDGRPAEADPVLQGITKAALSTSSFVAAASSSRPPRVLTDARHQRKRDYLSGLKENVIIGHLIPAGTGSRHYQTSRPVSAVKEDFSEELEIADLSEPVTGEEAG
jgi:DNA-directed RNA polymerase subunit beta'